MVKTTLNKGKYENAILYFMKYCNNNYLGVTKLYKLLYYLDFISFRDKKHSVTGDNYIHNQYGPVPENVDMILGSLKQDKAIKAEYVEYKENGTMTYEAKKDPDMKLFDKYEVTLLENICKEFQLWPTPKIVEQTHLEAPWFYSKPYDTVDYEYSRDIDFFLTK